MLRKIKFRAWDKENKIMLCIFDSTTQKDWYLPNWNTNYEIMQFTDLKDKNGVDIYESDICDTHTRWGRGIVKFENGMFKINGLSLCTFMGRLEVKGNIYNNPELLEGKTS